LYPVCGASLKPRASSGLRDWGFGAKQGGQTGRNERKKERERQRESGIKTAPVSS
jgi:hypothetical protein